MTPVPVAITIAGTDPSGGAGVAMDLRVFQALGLIGASVITAVNAQNSLGVRGTHRVPPRMVARQIDAVAEDYAISATKIGMLAGEQTVSVVAGRIRRRLLRNVVVDPVLAAKDGTPLLTAKGRARLLEEIAPRALVLTPNVPEAATLSGRAVRNLSDAREAARILRDAGTGWVLIKGGHWEDGPATDLLYGGDDFVELPGTRLPGASVRGTGCMFSAALAGFLARGLPVPDAAERAKAFTTHAIASATLSGKGNPVWFGPLEASS